jgi:hypothetical protein
VPATGQARTTHQSRRCEGIDRARLADRLGLFPQRGHALYGRRARRAARQRHRFELTRIAGKPTAGVIKGVAMLGSYQEMEADFSADNPGLTLLHCPMQRPMDHGFMALVDYAQVSMGGPRGAYDAARGQSAESGGVHDAIPIWSARTTRMTRMANQFIRGGGRAV